MTTGRMAEAAAPGTFPFRLERRGVVMAPLPGEPTEAWGVLNPATARRGDDTYLFPRIVAQGNFSRVGRGRVVFDASGTPVGVERQGTALEPEEAWELHAGGGGVEDPRITYVPRLERWIMTYTAFGPLGPRIGPGRIIGSRTLGAARTGLVRLPDRASDRPRHLSPWIRST
jgi:predicted GH43/DUF377 family glycosyl hydrolase